MAILKIVPFIRPEIDRSAAINDTRVRYDAFGISNLRIGYAEKAHDSAFVTVRHAG